MSGVGENMGWRDEGCKCLKKIGCFAVFLLLIIVINIGPLSFLEWVCGIIHDERDCILYFHGRYELVCLRVVLRSLSDTQYSTLIETGVMCFIHACVHSSWLMHSSLLAV